MAQVVRLNHEQQMQEQSAARIYQERYDMALQPWGRRAPEPVLGESIDKYRRKTLIKMKRQLPDDHKLRKVQVNQMEPDVLNIFEPQIMTACREEAINPMTVPRGELRLVPSKDPNGLTINNFIGQESFVKLLDCYRPGRRVTSFRTDHGYLDGSGRPLR
jgi:hypothetical protein